MRKMTQIFVAFSEKLNFSNNSDFFLLRWFVIDIIVCLPKYILNKKITIIIWEKSKRQPCGYSQLLSRAEFVFAIAPLMDLASYWSTKTQSSIIKSQNDHPLASWCSTKFEGRNKKKSKQLLIVVLLAGLFKNNVLNYIFEDLFFDNAEKY